MKRSALMPLRVLAYVGKDDDAIRDYRPDGLPPPKPKTQPAVKYDLDDVADAAVPDEEEALGYF